MARRKPEDMDVADMFRTLAQQVTAQAVKPNILAYVPHDKQNFFHRSMSHTRLYMGGNRSGKSYGAVAEDIWWATKTHPYRTMPDGPIRGRVVAVDFERGVNEILVPLFKSLIAPSMLVNGRWSDSYKEGSHKLTFANGSTIEFMSYEQDLEKFAGTSRHFVHYDEEPPRAIYEENEARLIDTEGSSWFSMTPVNGATWVFDDIYEPALDAEDKVALNVPTFEIAPVWESKSKDLTVIEVGSNENPHLDKGAQERFFSKLSKDDRAAREKGTFITIGGKVFKQFEISTHVDRSDIDPRELQKQGWQIYTSTDHGWNNPTAWLWHAVGPESQDGRVITFGEHYASEMTIEEHARVVDEREISWGLDREEIIRTGDPAMHQHSGITGTTVVQEYARHGLYIYTDSVPKGAPIGIVRMQQYFRLRSDGKPTWTIHESCGNFIKELRKLKWAQRQSKTARDKYNKEETVHKKDDHAFDSAKYFATFLQDLSPEEVEGPPVHAQRDGILRYDEALAAAAAGKAAREDKSEWVTLESFS